MVERKHYILKVIECHLEIYIYFDKLSDDIPKTSPEAINNLVLGVLSNILPEFQKAKSTLGELT